MIQLPRTTTTTTTTTTNNNNSNNKSKNNNSKNNNSNNNNNNNNNKNNKNSNNDNNNKSSITTVPIFYSIKNLVEHYEKESFEDEYTCMICMEFANESTQWYQCSAGHQACRDCWNKILSNKDKMNCMVCRLPFKSLTDGLSRNRFIETSFLNKKINCPYSFYYDRSGELIKDMDNGCGQLVKIKDLTEHQKNCESRFVDCTKMECSEIIRFKDILKHQDECGFSEISCKYCDKLFNRFLIEMHQKACSYKTRCSKCSNFVKRDSIQSHLVDECPSSIIPCTFKDYGCNIQMKRSELNLHLENINHIKYMAGLVYKQSQQINQQSQQINQQSQQINQQLQQINQQSQQLNDQSQELKKLSQRLTEIQVDLDLYLRSDVRYDCVMEKLSDIVSRLNILEDSDTAELTYSNSWTISNFLESVSFQDIETELIVVHIHRFYLKVAKIGPVLCFFLYRNDLFGPDDIKVKFIISIRNFKNGRDFEMVDIGNYSQNSRRSLRKPIHIFTKNKGFISDDDSIVLDFTISIIRTKTFES